MKDTFYFSHDYNARQDFKIKKLLAKHGLLGYGIYWAIIEDLYNNANAMQSDCEVIAFELRTDEKTIKSILNDFDLFVFDGHTFGSLSVERRLEMRNEKSEINRQNAISRWEKHKQNKIENNATAMQPQCNRNAKGKERKGKKGKKDSIGSFDFKSELLKYGFCPDLVSDWLYVRKSKGASNTKTAFNSFINQIEKINVNINDILEHVVTKTWAGFEAEWIEKDLPNPPAISLNNLIIKQIDTIPTKEEIISMNLKRGEGIKYINKEGKEEIIAKLWDTGVFKRDCKIILDKK